MLKRISQIILTLTVLLTVLGNTVRMGVCPCHRGVFIGDCVCNLHSHDSTGQDKCHGCPSCGHESSSLAKIYNHQEQGRNQQSFHNSGECHNALLETTAPFVFDPPFKFQEYEQIILSSFILAANDDLLIKNPGVFQSDCKLRPPPDLYRDTRQSYAGFMRPALA